MKTIQGENITVDILTSQKKKLVNQVFKLLPLREEGANWEKPLESLIIEINGMNSLIIHEDKTKIFSLVCKLEGLNLLQQDDQFDLYRKTLFECINILNEVMSKWQ